ncbi:MAG: haloacid dehalogenase type II [Nitrososphaerales archaeon]|nr:haloacid dehalogenase type II [Nitrososphaerales archaeon]
MRDFRYLTFDCYGTLIDWRTGIERALTKALGPLPSKGKQLLEAYVDAEKRQEGAYKSYRSVLGDAAMKLATQFGVDASPGAAAGFAASVPEWPAFPDTARALKDLGEAGYSRYILSNVDTDLLRKTISRNGLEVDGYVTAEDTKSYKPAFGHWLLFMERTRAKKSEILHVAQSIFHDIIPTGKLGIESAWVNRYGERLPSNVEPLFVCDSLSHLVGLMD